MMRLWYEQSADTWVEALPVGNGRLGAMIFGRTDREVLSLNEDTLWSGYPRDLNPQGKADFFRKAAELAKNKKYHEAQELVEKELTSAWTQSYMPLGDLILDYKHNGSVESYSRDLDISSAIASVEYSVSGVRYKREIIASAPDNIIAIKLSCSKPKSINFSMSFHCLLKSSVYVDKGLLILKGEAPSHVEPSYSNDLQNPVVYSDRDDERGMLFAAMAGVTATGGRVASMPTSIEVVEADEAVILIDVRTSFAGYDVHPYLNGKEFECACEDNIKHAAGKMYDTILSAHISDYRSYYDRVELDLGESEASTLPTDKRLNRFREVQEDPSLYTLLFQYGRYLLISSSREGTQPANLQGIWNSELRPPWSSNYTININAQMNYWLAFSCNLGELQQPFVNLIEELAVNGRNTACEVYGTRGFTSHHNTDIWRLTSPVGNHWKGSACFAFWNVSAGWLCRHLFDQYEYTLDKDFLQDKAYPIMKSAALFLLDVMTEDSQGYLIICPSTSPENTFIFEGSKCNISATTTMTITVARELFNNCIKCCSILNCDAEFADELKEKLKRLYPYRTGSKGQLLEWYDDYAEYEQGHRHISHLYGLYPSNEITVEDTPALAEACKVSLNLRGDEGTGWSLSWKINQWARLFDGNRALKLLNMQLRVVKDTGLNYTEGGGTYINMLDAHPPFQIDGNFGAASGIAEMLLQSREDRILILPALPSAWEKGCVKGLCAKGRVTVDIQWDKGLVKAKLLSDVDHNVSVAIKGTDFVKLELTAGIVTEIVG